MANVTNLRPGSSGSEVERLQQALVDAGYDVGKSGADGIFGDNTLAAVRQFQQDNGLTVDGVAGKNTLGALYGTAPSTGGQSASGSGGTNNNVPSTPTADPPAQDAPGADAPEAAPPAAAPEASFSYPGFSYDPYSQSDNVLQANALLQQHSANKPGAYQSQWEGVIQNYLNQIQNREDFSYDVNSDAMYQQYRDLYTQQGQLAMMDTMGQAAAMTGGYGNSYAQTVGQQVYNQQLNQLNEIVPELYQQAYDRYNQEGQELYNQYSLAMDQENMAYGRYQDQMNAWQSELDRLQGNYNAEREYDRSLYEADRALAYDAYSSDRTMAFNNYLDAYNRERDKVQDAQWQATFDEDTRRYNQEWEESQKPSVVYTSPKDEEPQYTTPTTSDDQYWSGQAKRETTLDGLNSLWGRMESQGFSPDYINAVLGPYIDALTKVPPKSTLVPPKGNVGGSGAGGTMYAEAR
jgi:peptidoglycan hydrolase-like protein with peptidoglycan-binding domain